PRPRIPPLHGQHTVRRGRTAPADPCAITRSRDAPSALFTDAAIARYRKSRATVEGLETMHESLDVRSEADLEHDQPDMLRAPRVAPNEHLETRRGSKPSAPGGLRAVFRQRRFRLGAVVALAVAVGLVVWAVTDNSGGSSSAQKPPTLTKIG